MRRQRQHVGNGTYFFPLTPPAAVARHGHVVTYIIDSAQARRKTPACLPPSLPPFFPLPAIPSLPSPQPRRGSSSPGRACWPDGRRGLYPALPRIPSVVARGASSIDRNERDRNIPRPRSVIHAQDEVDAGVFTLVRARSCCQAGDHRVGSLLVYPSVRLSGRRRLRHKKHVRLSVARARRPCLCGGCSGWMLVAGGGREGGGFGGKRSLSR